SEAGGYAEFLRKSRPEIFAEGRVVTSDGKDLGAHEGVAGFTVGQRRGIRISNNSGSPLYVLRVEPAENRVVVGRVDELLRKEVVLENVHWALPVERRMRVMAKIRYNMEAQPATLLRGEVPTIVFDEPVRAVTPGQIAVAYRGKTVAAGGTIAA
ncbi:MAG TPA: tRNA methyl transferase PRC-barrel domain-containing protein, partial [Fimbriimonas sp.]|nr:tRNA methyl transferase PRC-barrel domain-containing protein [Fimbriimonas sp.]